MSPSRHDPASDPDDPITASYDVFLTAPHAEQILLLQYPNRVRGRPYNDRHGACPADVRLKPRTGFLEVDVGLNTTFNFNKYKGLQWGDALATSRNVHNSSATYGPAAGFSGAKPGMRGASGGGGGSGTGRGGVMQDAVARENQLANDLLAFSSAEATDRVMRTQTLGGQIQRHDAAADEHGSSPVYFVGAFRGNELHLTKVDGTAQLRPQFHHLDAEEQRTRLQTSRASASAGLDPDAARPPPPPQAEARSVLAREKRTDGTERVRFEDRTRALWQDAEAESWVRLEYVDEDTPAAYEKFGERLFVRDVEGVARLESGVDGWGYLDLVGKGKVGATGGRRRKRGVRKRAGGKGDEGGEGEVDDEEMGEEADPVEEGGG
ncbi:hypothetical protein LTR53_011826 [Teratosphaeriaceae sp. CCFEE 6253]|nr:hypothetical protein LTR53_011826 [Teratosphaeriaceae sp. CCFEE 6253]